jgi:hypothetical protein
MFSASVNNRLNLLGFASEIKPAIALGMLNIKYHLLPEKLHLVSELLPETQVID